MKIKQNVQKTEEKQEAVSGGYQPRSAEECFLEFGPRKVAPVHDSIILYERFKLKYGVCEYANCNMLLDKQSGKTVGIIPQIPIDKVWEKSRLYTDEKLPSMSKGDWDEDKNLIMKLAGKKSGMLCVQDLWLIKELDFEELLLRRGNKDIQIIKAAVLYDIQESEEIIEKWKKIKKYIHRVELEKDNGGVFSKKDADILRQNGITCLNDVRKKSIYDLKNMFLEHNLLYLPEDINAAFKEDLARRRDKSYKIYPFIFGFAAIIITTVVGYMFRYTLIKNVKMTLLNAAAISMWILCIASVIWGAIRAVRRRKKRPSYRYFTKGVSTVFSFLVITSAFSLSSLVVFYERYDDYNDEFYFRNVSENEIAVAGLFDGDLTDLEIPSSYEGKTIVGITANAFKNKKGIESVEIADTVTSIGKNAFKNCYNLETVDLPSQLESIEKNTFYNCYNLSSANIPENVASIGKEAFFNTALTVVDIPRSVEAIGEGAFGNCYGLEAVTVKSYSIQIEKNAFRNCTNCESVTFNNTNAYTRVEESTFENCSSLRTADFLSKAVYIGKNAFKGCSSLKTVVINSSLEEMGEGALSGCTSLTSLSVPFFGKNADSQGTYSYLFDSSVPVQTISLTGTDVVPDRAFSGLTTLNRVSLPNSVKEIGSGAFSGCSGLTSFTIPYGVTEIKDSTFADCYSLSALNGTENVTKLGDWAFSNCGRLNTVAFNSAESIGAYCFNGCTNIVTVEEMPQLGFIGEYAFKDCYYISEIALPDSLEKISDHAFAYLRIDTLTVGNSVKAIGKYAFENSTINYLILGESVVEIEMYALASSYIKNIAIKGQVTRIAEGAFENCRSLESIDLPRSVEEIGANAFKNCSSLKSINLTVMRGSAFGANVFEGCTSLTGVLLPSGMTELPDGFFSGCTSLTGVTLPRVGSIGKNAFKDCPLYGIVLPDSVTEIKDGAFSGCKNIVRITIPNSVEAIGASVFSGCELLNSVKTPFLGKSRTEQSKGYSYLFGSDIEVTEVEITDSATIYKNTFKGGEQTLYSVTLGSGVQVIEKNAFNGFIALNYISLPETLTYIGDGAFGGSSLYSIDIPDSVTYLGKKAFHSCAFLTDVKLSASLEEIESSTFEKCLMLTRISIPDSVKTIKQKAFSECISLSAVNTGSGLEKISYLAFSNCYSLKQLNLGGGVEEISWGAFIFCSSLTKPELPSSVKVGFMAFLGCTSN